MNQKLAIVFLLILTSAFSACAQTSPIGNWYGDSVCQVKDSPCQTEKIVYRIIQMDDAGKFAI